MKSDYIRYLGADEISTGSPQNSAHMYIMHDTKSRPLDFSMAIIMIILSTTTIANIDTGVCTGTEWILL